jgi:hypothetical protein
METSWTVLRYYPTICLDGNRKNKIIMKGSLRAQIRIPSLPYKSCTSLHDNLREGGTTPTMERVYQFLYKW